MSSQFVTDNVLALILAGGEGERMKPLTTRRAKPSLPFAGSYRLIDFPLSNFVNSRVRDVWVVEQFQPHSLNDHLLNGRPWDLDRNRGGLRLLPPHTGGESSDDFHEGNADALWHHAQYIREFAPELLIVGSADHIYKLDLRPVLEAHRDTHAEATIVTTQVPQAAAGRYGTLKTDHAGRVNFWDYKPDEPQSGLIATEVFVYSAHVLLEVLEQLAKGAADDKKGETQLKDFGDQLLPALVKRGETRAFPLDGYWRDVGTIESYWEGHMDLLRPDYPLRLDDPAWPLLTAGSIRLPARVQRGAQVENSLLSPGCTVGGTVINSVLCPGVVVEAGAVVRDSVVLNDSWIKSEARLSHTVVNEAMLVLGIHEGTPQKIAVIARET